MSAGSPLIFRPSLSQRAMAGLLCVGCWLVGVRAVSLLMAHLPLWYTQLGLAQAKGEPVVAWWCLIAGAILACLAAGLVLLLVILGFVLIEGCQVITDGLGLTVEYHTLPPGLARRFGAGRLGWKQILSLEKRGWSFVVGGDPKAEEAGPRLPLQATFKLRFLVVAELERLILLILEQSPNLK